MDPQSMKTIQKAIKTAQHPKPPRRIKHEQLFELDRDGQAAFQKYLRQSDRDGKLKKQMKKQSDLAKQ
jgi:hypothetical protein